MVDIEESINKTRTELTQEATCLMTNTNVPLAVDQEETPNTLTSTIPYSVNTLFGISCRFLQRIAMFIKQCSLKESRSVLSAELFRHGGVGIHNHYL